METNLSGLTWRRCAHDSEHTVVDCVRTTEPDPDHDIEFNASYAPSGFAAIATNLDFLNPTLECMFLKVRESKSPEDVQEIPQADDPLLGTAALCALSGGASAESDFGFCEGVCTPSPTQAGV